ncbi:hypothetical protein WL77_24195 [Burkholderia ubonensis]|nr:hypothetical protein WL77_24195 [Burkholderia ubonensis]KWE80102.1 hypothetical protein WL79_02100 [Burkholderia ubonensis]
MPDAHRAAGPGCASERRRFLQVDAVRQLLLHLPAELVGDDFLRTRLDRVALLLSRAIADVDPALADEILEAGRQSLADSSDGTARSA